MIRTSTIVSCLHRRTSTLASTTSTSSSHYVSTIKETETAAKPFRDIPGPTGVRNIPFLGMALNFKPFTGYGPFQLTEVFTMLRNRYGDIFRTHMGKQKTVHICHPEIAEELLRLPWKENKRVVIAIAETMYKRNNINVRAISQLNGPEWETTRKLVQQNLMKPRSVKVFFPSINWSLDILIEQLQKKGNVNDMLYELQKFTVDTIGMVTLNRDLGNLQNTAAIDLPAVIDPILRVIHETFFLPLNTYKYFRTKLYDECESNFLIVHKFVHDLCKEQEAELMKIVEEGMLDEHMENNYNVFHGLLAEGNMSPDKITSIILDFFTTGITSSASIILSVLTDLANNPDKQKVLYDELLQVVGNESEITKEHYDKMSYLKACVKESYRMRYPSFAGMIRFMETDAIIAGYTIPEDTQVIVHNEMMCSDERFFPKPMEYLPERWMRDGSADHIAKAYSAHPFIVKPFGHGARSCLGQRIAEVLTMTCVATIVKSFHVTLPYGKSDIKWSRRVFPVPDEKVPMCFNHRET